MKSDDALPELDWSRDAHVFVERYDAQDSGFPLRTLTKVLEQSSELHLAHRANLEAHRWATD